MTDKPRVLVVDDDVPIQNLLKRRFKNLYEISCATYQDEAFAALATSTFDVVLLDLKLPKVDGLEVLRRIRADDRTKLVPVVVLTSSDEERDVVQSYQIGANSYVRKPVDFAQFLDAARQLELYWLVLNQSPPRP